MLDSHRIFLFALDFVLISQIEGADRWCDSFYDENKVYYKEKPCPYRSYCCGTCTNRTCCTDSAFYLKQSSCSSYLSLWLIILISISSLLLVYFVIMLLRAACTRANRFSSRPTNQTNSNSQSVSQVPSYDSQVYRNMNDQLFQQDNPPSYDSLKLDPMPTTNQKQSG